MKGKLRLTLAKVLKVFTIVTALFAIGLFVDQAFAAAGSQGVALSSITKNVNSTVSQMARIFTDIALIAGIGFIMASFFKFHQHKLNPQQVPISQGVTLLLIGAALMLFTVMLPTAKRAVFGTEAKIAQVGGSGMSAVIGSGGSTK